MPALAVTCLALAAAAIAPETSSKIVAVTVYPDRAEVTRESALTIPAGTSAFLIGPLPMELEDTSLRVAGHTPAGGKLSIAGVEMRVVPALEIRDPELTAAEADLALVQARSRRLDDTVASIGRMRQLLESLHASSAARIAGQMAGTELHARTWQEAYDFLRRNLDSLAAEERTTHEARGDLGREASVAAARVASLKNRRRLAHKRVAVTVDSDAPVELTLTIRYAQPGAGWAPFYEATMDPDSDQLVLDMFAWVKQSTGERWDDVRLTLATGAPSLGIDLPRLSSLVLQPLEPSVAGGFSDLSEHIEGLPILGKNYQELLPLAPGVTGSDSDGNPNLQGSRDTSLLLRLDGGNASEAEPSGAKKPAPPHANVVQKLALHSQADTVMTFDVPSRLTLDPDGQPRRVAISRAVLSARREYLVVPTIRPAAYLIAKVAAPADRPLLEGSVKHYIGSTLVGSSTLAASAPGEEIVLSFGVDDRVKVDRPSRPGMTQVRGRDQIVQVERRVAITNRTGKPISVAVKDRVPVSSHEDVRVSIAQETSAGHVEDGSAPGVLSWSLALSPDESREVTLAYAVRSPYRTPLSARR